MKAKQIDKKRTKRRDIIIFALCLLGIGYLIRDDLLILVKDGASWYSFDMEYDEYLIASDEVYPLATEIVGICNKQKACPETPVGWVKMSNDQWPSRGKFVYQPFRQELTKNKNGVGVYDRFRIIYDYDSEWRVVAVGGVGMKVELERQKR